MASEQDQIPQGDSTGGKSTGEESIDDPKLPLTAHLEELRKRMLIAGAVIMVGFVACWSFSGQILAVIEAPLQSFTRLQFDTLTDPFFSHLKAAFYTSIFLTFPVTLSQIWLFVSPGLYKREKSVMWPFLLLSFPLFVGGGSFFYFLVFPVAIDFLLHFDPNLVPSLRIGDYLSFTLSLLFVFGLVFEMPLISLLLTRMGLINARMLSRFRRYAVVLIFIVAAILTPPDVVSQLLLAGPLLVLYEVSILVSWLAKRKPEASTPDAADKSS